MIRCVMELIGENNVNLLISKGGLSSLGTTIAGALHCTLHLLWGDAVLYSDQQGAFGHNCHPWADWLQMKIVLKVLFCPTGWVAVRKMWPADTEFMASPLCLCVAARIIVRCPWDSLFIEVGWLVGFLTSSSTTRLYRGRALRQSVWQLNVLPHMRQSWETMTSVSAGFIEEDVKKPNKQKKLLYISHKV